MAKASVPLMKAEYKRRAYTKPTVDPIKDAAIISEHVRKGNCFTAFLGILLMAVAGLIAAVLS